MATTVFTLTAKTYDAALLDLTAMTGGSGASLGYQGSDWLHLNSASAFTATETWLRKDQGGSQIIPVLYTSGGNAAPTTGNTPAQSNIFTCDTDDRTTGSSATFSGGLAINVPNTALGNGCTVTFPLSRSLKTFWWLGHTRNGSYQVDATMSDAAAGPLSLALPIGLSNVYEPGWFQVTFRGTYFQVAANASITIKISRIGGASATSQIHCRPWVLLVPVVPPRQRGIPAGRR